MVVISLGSSSRVFRLGRMDCGYVERLWFGNTQSGVNSRDFGQADAGVPGGRA